MSGGGGAGRLGGTGDGTLAADAATLTLAEATPDAELLAVGQGVLKAVGANLAALAHGLGLLGGCTALGEEEIGVDTEAVRRSLPTVVFFLDHLSCHPVRTPA